jgi:DNA-binding transcriptional MerR regulator
LSRGYHGGMTALLLKVGELAKRTGLTVRTLHHYDEIGLLKPSGRSESGYRLYSQADVARLHGIQALRHLGLALGDIGAMLDGGGTSPALIMEQQMRSLDHEIEQATALRDRLAVMQVALSDGKQPGMAEWLETLALMTTYGKYFTGPELKIILGNWKLIEPQWLPLVEKMRHAMDSGLTPESPVIQPLAQRWMGLMLRWMDGDFDLIDRWGDMYDKEPTAHRWQGAPQRDMVAFVRRAIDLRVALLCKYLDLQEMRRFRHVPDADWQALASRVGRLMDAGEKVAPAEVAAAVQAWLGLLDRLVDHQPGVRDKLLRAHAAEPLLRAGSTLGERESDYLRRAVTHRLTLT